MAETTYVKKTDDGKGTIRRIASTPAEHVQCQFDGFVPEEKSDKETPKASPAGGGDKPPTTK